MNYDGYNCSDAPQSLPAVAGQRSPILCLVRPEDKRMRILNRLYAFIGWAIVALGGLHMLATLRLSAAPPLFRLWFFGSGIAMALVGVLNLLHRAYGHAATGLRIACWIANILLTLFALAAGALTHAGMAEYVLIVSLVGGASLLSLVYSARLTGDTLR